MKVKEIKIGARVRLKDNIYPDVKYRTGIIIRRIKDWDKGKYHLHIKRANDYVYWNRDWCELADCRRIVL